jgi:hypothetical protein
MIFFAGLRAANNIFKSDIGHEGRPIEAPPTERALMLPICLVTKIERASPGHFSNINAIMGSIVWTGTNKPPPLALITGFTQILGIILLFAAQVARRFF